MVGEARGKKYGESDVEGVDDDAVLFWFCRGRGDEGDSGVMLRSDNKIFRWVEEIIIASKVANVWK